jgi:hypothetical protein
MSRLQRRWIDHAAAGMHHASIDFFEGVNSPDAVIADQFNAEDAAAFDAADDEDVIFKIEARQHSMVGGLRFNLVYGMETSEAADIKLRLEYLPRSAGVQVDSGTPTVIEHVVTPNATANQQDVITDFEIPAGDIADTDNEIECRLTRLGTDPADTHTGYFGLKAIVIEPLH